MSSEMVRVICPHCRRVYDLTADVAAKRKKAQCGRCRKTFEIAGRAQPIIARAAEVAARQQATPTAGPPTPPPLPAAATPPPIPASARGVRTTFPPPGIDFDKAETLPPAAGPGRPRIPDTIRPGQAPPPTPEEVLESLDAEDILPESPDAFEPMITEGARQRALVKAQSASERAGSNEIELAALEVSTLSLGPAEVRPRPNWLAHAEAVLAAPPSTSAPPSA